MNLTRCHKSTCLRSGRTYERFSHRQRVRPSLRGLKELSETNLYSGRQGLAAVCPVGEWITVGVRTYVLRQRGRSCAVAGYAQIDLQTAVRCTKRVVYRRVRKRIWAPESHNSRGTEQVISGAEQWNRELDQRNSRPNLKVRGSGTAERKEHRSNRLLGQRKSGSGHQRRSGAAEQR